MSEFARALRSARLTAKKKLRETAESASLSIGYLSDIERGRKKSLPDLETVRLLQEFLCVDGNRLVILASEARSQRPIEIARYIRRRPRLSDLFLRAKNMSDEQLDNLLSSIPG